MLLCRIPSNGFFAAPGFSLLLPGPFGVSTQRKQEGAASQGDVRGGGGCQGEVALVAMRVFHSPGQNLR